MLDRGFKLHILGNMAGEAGIEPTSMVLETMILTVVLLPCKITTIILSQCMLKWNR